MIIYLAGPYRGKSKIKIINWFQRQINIHRAREAAKRLWAAGFTVLCPHLNTANFDGIAPDEVFLNGTLELMRRCDAMVLLPNWEKSSGTKAEVEEMRKLNKQIHCCINHFLLDEKGKSNGLSSHSRSGRDTKATTKEETAGEETQKQYYFTQQGVKTDNSPSTEKSKRASAGKECFLFLRVMSGVRRIAGYCRRRPTPLPQERKPRRTRHAGAYMDVQKDMS